LAYLLCFSIKIPPKDTKFPKKDEKDILIKKKIFQLQFLEKLRKEIITKISFGCCKSWKNSWCMNKFKENPFLMQQKTFCQVFFLQTYLLKSGRFPFSTLYLSKVDRISTLNFSTNISFLTWINFSNVWQNEILWFIFLIIIFEFRWNSCSNVWWP